MWFVFALLSAVFAALTSILAKEFGLALGDGSHYGKQADGFMRLNIGCTRDILRQGLEGLERFYQTYVK